MSNPRKRSILTFDVNTGSELHWFFLNRKRAKLW